MKTSLHSIKSLNSKASLILRTFTIIALLFSFELGANGSAFALKAPGSNPKSKDLTARYFSTLNNYQAKIAIYQALTVLRQYNLGSSYIISKENEATARCLSMEDDFETIVSSIDLFGSLGGIKAQHKLKRCIKKRPPVFFGKYFKASTTNARLFIDYLFSHTNNTFLTELITKKYIGAFVDKIEEEDLIYIAILAS